MSQATIYVPRDPAKGMCFIVEDDPGRRDWFVAKLGMPRIYGFFDKPEEAISHLNWLNDHNETVTSTGACSTKKSDHHGGFHTCCLKAYHKERHKCMDCEKTWSNTLSLENMYAFFLDHDLGGPYQPPYSTDIAKRMHELDPKIGNRTVIHSANEPGARNLQAILPGSVYFPFGFFDIADAQEKS